MRAERADGPAGRGSQAASQTRQAAPTTTAGEGGGGSRGAAPRPGEMLQHMPARQLLSGRTEYKALGPRARTARTQRRCWGGARVGRGGAGRPSGEQVVSRGMHKKNKPRGGGAFGHNWAKDRAVIGPGLLGSRSNGVVPIRGARARAALFDVAGRRLDKQGLRRLGRPFSARWEK